MRRNSIKMVFFKYVIIVMALESVWSFGQKKSKKTKNYIPSYEDFTSDYLPNDLQVTAFLRAGEERVFNYWSTTSNLQLSVVITGCSTKITSRLSYKTNVSELINNDTIYNEMQVFRIRAQLGLYVLQLTGENQDTYVHVYVSTEAGGPEALSLQNKKSLVVRQLRNKKVVVKWEPSLVDPQFTEYCLVASNAKHYGSFCGAEADRYGVATPGANYRRPVAASQTIISWEGEDHQNKYEFDPFIRCVGKKTQLYTYYVQRNKPTYFDLFAINRQTNFTYLLASNTSTFKGDFKASPLKDGRFKFINLRQQDGMAVVKYKVGKKTKSDLEIYLMPCGGAVDVEITLQQEIVESKRMVEGYGKMLIPNPVIGSRYYIKIYSTNKEELRRTSGVQLYVTSKSSANIPLPDMPALPIVKEYTSLRSCDGVTVGWLPSPGEKSAHYCVVVKEGKLRDGFKQINQCGLENRLRKSSDFVVKSCRDIKHGNDKVLTQRINHLKPGKAYIVQVTVRKRRGKTISYNLLQVQTKGKCVLS